MFRKRPTIQYPSLKKQHAPRFHGLHELRRYDDGKERCIGCELCSSVCPANAITVIGAENAPDDRRSPGERYAARYEIDELRCIFCGMCEEACPTDAIVLTPRFEMADYRRGSFIYDKDRLLVPPDAGVGHAPDERPGGIPGDLGRVAEIKSTDRRSRRATTRRGAARSSRAAQGLALIQDPRPRMIGVLDHRRHSRSRARSGRLAAKKPVYSVVALLLNFAALAVLYVTLSAEFLAVMQIIVYSGAILVLFVFVIALLSSGVAPFCDRARTGCRRSALPAAVFVLAALGFLVYAVSHASPARDAASALRRPGRRGERFRQRRRLRQGALYRAAAALRSHGADPDGRRHRRRHARRRADARRRRPAATKRKVDRSMREAILREGKG